MERRCSNSKKVILARVSETDAIYSHVYATESKNDKSTWVRVMCFCRQEISHYLGQCLPIPRIIPATVHVHSSAWLILYNVHTPLCEDVMHRYMETLWHQKYLDVIEDKPIVFANWNIYEHIQNNIHIYSQIAKTLFRCWSVKEILKPTAIWGFFLWYGLFF